MVAVFKCRGCGNRGFNFDKNDAKIYCQTCIKHVAMGGVSNDRAWRPGTRTEGEILAGNVETVASVWEDHKFESVSQGGPAISATNEDVGAQREVEADNNGLPDLQPERTLPE